TAGTTSSSVELLWSVKRVSNSLSAREKGVVNSKLESGSTDDSFRVIEDEFESVTVVEDKVLTDSAFTTILDESSERDSPNTALGISTAHIMMELSFSWNWPGRNHLRDCSLRGDLYRIMDFSSESDIALGSVVLYGCEV
ncbi:unnamed protein product, partial [Cyprideis torosa]